MKRRLVQKEVDYCHGCDNLPAERDLTTSYKQEKNVCIVIISGEFIFSFGWKGT